MASVFICLGGTGWDIMEKLKTRISLTPVSPSPRFLLVDFQPPYAYNPDGSPFLDCDREFFSLVLDHIKSAFLSVNDKTVSPKWSWLNYRQLRIKRDGQYSGGGVRQLGRFCLMEKAEPLKEKLTGLIREAAEEGGDDVHVSILSSLSGGTGGAVFLDISYIIRQILEESGIHGGTVEGCFFLPDVTLSIPGAAAGGSILTQNIKSYGYSALKELDYLMSLGANRDRFVQDYGSFRIDTDCPPFDRCALVSASPDGTDVSMEYKAAIKGAEEYILSLLTAGTVPETAPVDQPGEGKGKEENHETGICQYYFVSMDGESLICRRQPLYEYSQLADLERTYEADAYKSGRHLYENGGVDWREYLPSPIPASFVMNGHHIPRIEERNKKLLEELDTARKIGIVCSDYTGWYVNCSRIADIPSLSAIGAPELLKEARAHMFDDDHADRIRISTANAHYGCEEIVFRDNYLRFPKIQQMVRAQLGKVRALDQEIMKMEERQSFAEAKKLFFTAVFTGVIQLSRSKITFSYEESGENQVLVLQDTSMPYGVKAPLYQAYLTFQELKPEMTQRIQDETNKALDTRTREVRETVRGIQNKYSSDFLEMTLAKAAWDPRRKEIRDFYMEFMNALVKFQKEINQEGANE